MANHSSIYVSITPESHPILHEIPKLNKGTLWVEAKSKEALSLFQSIPYQCLGVVGSRAPQPKSRLLLERTMKALAGSGVVVMSGLAKGIDAEAHRWAMDLGLKTVAVIAHGFHHHYPSETANLRREIIEQGGLILSEYPPEQEPRPYQFVHRNRIIAAFSRAVWVVQAGKSSGALNTARWTLEMQRELFVTPCFPGDASLAGNEQLLQNPEAVPLWSAETLSSVWLDLFSQLKNPRPSLYH
jgi:DNA processing protein